MAGKSTISITFKLDGDGKVFKDLSQNADGLKQAMTAAIPMGRMGQADEVANAVVWLASPAASYVTGSLLDVRGGF